MVDKEVRAHFGLLVHAKFVKTYEDCENKEPSLGHNDLFSCKDNESEEMDQVERHTPPSSLLYRTVILVLVDNTKIVILHSPVLVCEIRERFKLCL